MRRRKLWILILLSLMCAGVLFGAAACGESDCEKGLHTWGEWSTTATCTEKGIATRTCTVCGEKEEREAEALGHDWGEYTVKEGANCEEGGIKERACKRCTQTEELPVEKLGHDPVKTAEKASTCTEKGNIEYYTCSRCHKKFADAACTDEREDVSRPLLPHSMTVFEEEGTGHRAKCSVCGHPAEELSEHSYDFDDTHADSLHHWGVCVCGAEDEESLHTYESGECTVCGHAQEAFTAGLSYELDTVSDTYTVTGRGEATAAEIVIPAIHDGKVVGAIGNSAFEDDTSLISIVIPDGVTTVGESAFEDCEKLATVTIGKSVRSFDAFVFYGTNISHVNYTGAADDWCRISFDRANSHPFFASAAGTRIIYLADGSPLENVTVPADVTEIGKYAFYQCESLKSVTAGEQVKSIGEQAFYNCTSLEEITLADGGAESIGDNAFYGCGELIEAVLPDGLETLGKNAFEECAKLYLVELPSTLQAIPEYAFKGCGTLMIVESGGGLQSIGGSAFLECAKLNEINLCEGILTIGDSAFKDCAMLAEISLPKSLTSIGNNAFNGCEKLLSVTIPAACTSIGSYAFGSSGLTSVTIEEGTAALTIGTQYAGYTFQYTNISEIDLPDRVTTLGPNTFYGCTSLAEVHIGKGVSSVGEAVFYGCTSLTTITIDAENPVIAFETGCFIDKTSKSILMGFGAFTIPENAELVTSIGKGAFKNNADVKTLTIPQNISSISEQAFQGCTELASVTLPNGLTALPDFVFQGCTKLTGVTFGNVQSIGKSAFKDCTLLGKVTLPDTLTTIGASAFRDCENLETTIGEHVTYVGQFAFQGCVKCFTMKGHIQYIGNWVVGINEKSLTSISADMFEEGTVGIGGGAFNFMESLQTLALPEGLKYLGDESFSECDLLNSVTLPSTLERIGYNAFYNCASLQEIVIPASVNVIERGAFSCGYGAVSSLKSVTLEGSGTWKRYYYSSYTGLSATGTAFANASDPQAVATQIKADSSYEWRRESL